MKALRISPLLQLAFLARMKGPAAKAWPNRDAANGYARPRKGGARCTYEWRDGQSHNNVNLTVVFTGRQYRRLTALRWPTIRRGWPG